MNHQKSCCRQEWINGFFLMILVLWPASFSQAADEWSSIQGMVKVLDRNGTPKNDYSGVVVFLDDLKGAPAVVPSGEKAVIRQVDKRFIPKVLPVLAGTAVEFPNDDVIYHNVFSLSKAKTFDLGIYAKGSSKSVTFDNPGLVKIYCNIHPQMVAYILVLANPYFAMTDRDGRFKLENVPAGEATVRTWYPGASRHPEKRVIVTPQGIRDLDLTLVEDVRLQIQEETISVEHKNKWGQDYPAKY